VAFEPSLCAAAAQRETIAAWISRRHGELHTTLPAEVPPEFVEVEFERVMKVVFAG
jgi:hypothetical protein